MPKIREFGSGKKTKKNNVDKNYRSFMKEINRN